MDEAAKPIKKILTNTSKVVKDFGKVLKAQAFKTKAAGIKELALSLLIMAAAVYLLAQLDGKKLWISVGAIAALSGILIALSFAMDKLSSASIELDGASKTFKVNGLKSSLIGLGIVLILMAATAKILGSMDIHQYTQGMLGLAGLVAMIIGVLASFGLLVKGKSAQNIDKAGKMFRKLAVTLLIMAAVVKIVGSFSWSEIGKGITFMAAFAVFMAAVELISLIPGKNMNRLGKLMSRLSWSMILMVAVMKLVGSLDIGEIIKGTAFLFAFLIFTALLVSMTTILKDQTIAKVSGLVLSITFAMALMVGVVKIVSLLSPSDMLKGAAFASAFALFVGLLVAVTKIGSDKQIAKVSGMILSVAIAMAIMAGLCALLGMLDPHGVVQGLSVLTVLILMMSLLLVASHFAVDAKGTIMAMAVVISILVIAVAALSFIDPKDLLPATLAITAMMAMFALILYESKNLDECKDSLIAMTIIIGILNAVLLTLCFIPYKRVIIAAAALSLVMLSLAIAMKEIGKAGSISKQAVASLAAIAVIVGGLTALIYALTAFSGGGFTSMIVSVGLLCVALAALAIAVKSMNGAIAGAVALTVVSLALMVLLPVLQQLGSMSLEQVGISLLVLAGAFVVIGVAGALLQGIVGPIIGLSAAILLLGVGAMAAGIGMAEFAKGLLILTTLGPAGIQTLTNVLLTLVKTIPAVITALATSLITNFLTFIPQIVECVTTLLTTLLTSIAEKIPIIVQAGCDIIIGLLNGIRNNIYTFTTIAGDIMVEFIMGISNKIPDLIQAGVELVFSFIDGIADAFANNGERAREALINLGKSMWKGIKDFFGVHSPSKKFKDLGKFLIQGLINGIKSLGSGAVSAIKKVGEDMLSGIQSKASKFFKKGKHLMGKLKDGITGKCDEVAEGARQVVDKARGAINAKKDEFSEAGGNLMNGLKNGIDSIKNVASNLKTKFTDFFGIHSPSRVFAKFGRYLDEGLIVGIKAYYDKVYSASKDMGKKAINGVENAINSAKDLFNNSNSQPVISPVVDLSNVKTGVRAIGSMLNGSSMTSLNIGTRAVSSMMNKRIQNGNNSDLLNAINKLDSRLDNLGNVYYNIDGITYDDGTNVSNAVQSLFRAARIERRI